MHGSCSGTDPGTVQVKLFKLGIVLAGFGLLWARQMESKKIPGCHHCLAGRSSKEEQSDAESEWLSQHTSPRGVVNHRQSLGTRAL